MNWLQYYPPKCPPRRAQNKNLTPVYQFVRSTNISVNDFAPHISKDPVKYKGICKACGTSVYSNLSEINRIKAITPCFRNMFIAEGSINKSDGKILKTPTKVCRYHITWWINTSSPHVSFKVIP